MRTPFSLLAVPGLLAALIFPAPSGSQTLQSNLWVTNGYVLSIVPSGGTLYVGGNFDQVGPATGGWVGINAGTGSVLQPYPLVAGTVFACAPDGTGGWYVGGSFTGVQGQPRNNLAHIDAAGSVTSWDPNPNICS